MSAKKITLERGERIVAVVPERAAGPGWSNAPTWVWIVGSDNKARCECIQPDERTAQLHTLYAAGEVIHAALISSVPTTPKRCKAKGGVA